MRANSLYRRLLLDLLILAVHLDLANRSNRFHLENKNNYSLIMSFKKLTQLHLNTNLCILAIQVVLVVLVILAILANRAHLINVNRVFRHLNFEMKFFFYS